MENKEQNLEIATIILTQLESLNKMALLGWGSRNFTTVKNGLMFQINTPRISNGWVKIVLNIGEDLYELEFFNNRKKLLSRAKGVFFDELINTIDFNIEKEEYYKRIRN